MTKDIDTARANGTPAAPRTRRGFLDAVTLKVAELPGSLRVTLGLPLDGRRHAVTMTATRDGEAPRTLAFHEGSGGAARRMDLLEGLAAFGMGAPGEAVHEGGRTCEPVGAAYACFLGREVSATEAREVATLVAIAARGLAGGLASWVDPAAVALLAHGTGRTAEAYAALAGGGAGRLRAAVARYPMLASQVIASGIVPGGDGPEGTLTARLWEDGLGTGRGRIPPLEFHVLGWLDGLRIDGPGWTEEGAVNGLALANVLPRRVLPRTRDDLGPFLLSASHAHRFLGKARGKARNRAWDGISARVTGAVESGGWRAACEYLASALA